MRRADRVAIIFQHAPDDAFVTLIGKATLHESESEVGERWTDANAPTIISTLSEKFTALNIPAGGISISLSKTLD